MGEDTNATGNGPRWAVPERPGGGGSDPAAGRGGAELPGMPMPPGPYGQPPDRQGHVAPPPYGRPPYGEPSYGQPSYGPSYGGPPSYPGAPYGQVPPYGYGYGGGYQPAITDKGARTSLILGIVSLFICGVILGPAAMIEGGKARKRIASSNGTLTGDGMAIAGMVLGLLATLVSLYLIVRIFSTPATPRSTLR